MNKIIVEYNPYEKNESKISVKSNNGEWDHSNGLNGSYFDSFAFKIPKLIIREIIPREMFEIDIEFIGRKSEYSVLKDVCEYYSSKDVNYTFNVIHKSKYDYDVNKFLKEIDLLPANCLVKKKKDFIVSDMNANITMHVIGNYSTGKSTLINAMLKQEILYSYSGIGTKKLLRIINTENNQQTIQVQKENKWIESSHTDNGTTIKEKLKKYNGQNNIKEIKLNMKIPVFQYWR